MTDEELYRSIQKYINGAYWDAQKYGHVPMRTPSELAREAAGSVRLDGAHEKLDAISKQLHP
jgi:hypothetical protein